MQQLTLGKFQIFDALPEERYQALKAAIAHDGVLVAVEIDQNGQVLDGHHRIKAWNALRAEGVNVADYPRMIRTFDNDDDREEHAAKLNSNRRDVSTENKKRLAVRWRERGWSYRRIADALAVNHETIRRWMPEPDSTVAHATVDLPPRVIGKDGKSRPATMPKPAVMATSAKEQERALDALDELNGDEFISTATGEIMTSKDVQRAAKNRHKKDTEKQAKTAPPKPTAPVSLCAGRKGEAAPTPVVRIGMHPDTAAMAIMALRELPTADADEVGEAIVDLDRDAEGMVAALPAMIAMLERITARAEHHLASRQRNAS